MALLCALLWLRSEGVARVGDVVFDSIVRGQPNTAQLRGIRSAGDRGVEPRVAVLETTVLPIHQSPEGSAL